LPRRGLAKAGTCSQNARAIASAYSDATEPFVADRLRIPLLCRAVSSRGPQYQMGRAVSGAQAQQNGFDAAGLQSLAYAAGFATVFERADPHPMPGLSGAQLHALDVGFHAHQ